MQIKFPSQETKVVFSVAALLWREKTKIVAGLAVLVMGAFLLARSVSGAAHKYNDYLQAASYQAKLKEHKDVSQKELLGLLKKHPELKPVFAHYLEQQYAIQGDALMAKKVSEETLKRVSFMDPLYQEYAKISLLIEEGKQEEALTQSKLLKEKIHALESPNLYGLNLIRIAFLDKESKEEVRSLVSSDLSSHLTDDNLSLLDFVLTR